MRRAIAIAIVLGLTVCAGAGAARVPTGALRSAIERAASPQTPAGIPQRCLLVRVTTKDGGAWAAVGFYGARDPSLCNRYGFNGVSIVRRLRNGWRYVTAGSAMIPCGRLGIPVAAQRDLGLPCRPASTPKTPPATSGAAFWPGSAAITCILKDNGTAWVFCWVGSQWPPTTYARMGLDGLLDRTTVIAEPIGLGGPGLQYGKSVTVGRFRCSSSSAGLTCVVITTGKGLLIGPSGITSVG